MTDIETVHRLEREAGLTCGWESSTVIPHDDSRAHAVPREPEWLFRARLLSTDEIIACCLAVALLSAALVGAVIAAS